MDQLDIERVDLARPCAQCIYHLHTLSLSSDSPAGGTSIQLSNPQSYPENQAFKATIIVRPEVR